MAKFDILEDPPTTIDPYKVLEIPKTASEAEVKSAYKKLALKRHPDKAPAAERDAAHTAFQSLAFAYAVLSDPKRRARYDRTGSLEESIVDDDGFNWTDFFRTQFADIITTERIEEMKREYQGSEKETQDILKAYEKYKGDLDKILESVMLSEVLEDEDRIRTIIERAIEAGEAQSWDKFTKETKKTRDRRRKRALKEREEAERAAAAGSNDEDADNDDEDEDEDEMQRIPAKKSASGRNPTATKEAKGASKSKPKKQESMNDLAALIQQRQAGRAATSAAFFDSLEARYGGEVKGKKGRKRVLDEPSEEAFAAMRKRGKGQE